jgi:perosamine synthetase
MANLEIPWWQVKFGESARNAASNEIANGRLSMGATTRKFEEEICEKLKVNFCVATSGTNALLMALLAMNVSTNDVIAIQDRSWISPAHAAHLLGAEIMLIDVDKDNPVASLEHVQTIITRKPKVVILVHMNGRAPKTLGKIVKLCREQNIGLIEDAAQAIGSKSEGRYLGTMGDIGCFSLAVSKTVSSGQGGFCVTDNADVYQKLLRLRTHGVTDVFEPTWTSFGMNWRFTDIQAAIALDQLDRLEDRLMTQKLHRSTYEKALRNLEGIRILPISEMDGESGPYYDAWVRNPIDLINFLSSRGIGCRRFYPSLSEAKYLRINNIHEISNAKDWHQHGVILPSGPDLTQNQLKKVVDSLVHYFIELNLG